MINISKYTTTNYTLLFLRSNQTVTSIALM